MIRFVKKFFYFQHSRQVLLATVLAFMIVFSIVKLLLAATPNPGHPWSGVGDGNFAVTGQTAPRTYTLPDASTTILTTNSLVSVAQGGTGSSSLTGVLIGNGTSAVTATTSPDGLLVSDISSSTLTNKTINLSNNQFAAAYVSNHEGYSGYDEGLLKSNGSKFVRMNLGSALQLLRTSSDASNLEWATSGVSVAGSDQEVQFNSGGSSVGATSSLTWNNANSALKLVGYLQLPTSTLPSVAATGTMKLANNQIIGRNMLLARTHVTNDYYALQPSLFQNFFVMIAAGFSSIPLSLGVAIDNSGGSRGHSVSETSGLTMNWPTSAVSSSVAGVYTQSAIFYRGSTDGINGFFAFARVYFTDASYAQSGTGSRIFVGLSTGGTNDVLADDAAGDRVGFSYMSVNGGRNDTYWTITSKDGATESLTTSTTAFTRLKLYDLYLYCLPQASEISWRVDNVTDSTTESGLISSNLPTASTAMKAGASIGTVNAVARTIKVQKIYVEVPR